MGIPSGSQKCIPDSCQGSSFFEPFLLVYFGQFEDVWILTRTSFRYITFAAQGVNFSFQRCRKTSWPKEFPCCLKPGFTGQLTFWRLHGSASGLFCYTASVVTLVSWHGNMKRVRRPVFSDAKKTRWKSPTSSTDPWWVRQRRCLGMGMACLQVCFSKLQRPSQQCSGHRLKSLCNAQSLVQKYSHLSHVFKQTVFLATSPV